MASGDFNKLENLLLQIDQKIELGEIKGEEGAVASFNTYIESLIRMRLYDISHWPKDWKRKHLLLFSHLKNAPKLRKRMLRILEEKLSQFSKKEEREVLHYLYLGILFCLDEEKRDSAMEYVEPLLKQYPKNADFHLYCALCHSERGSHKRAVEEVKRSMKLSNHAEDYVTDMLNIESKYLDDLIMQHKFEDAEQFLFSMQRYYQAYFGGPDWVLLHRQLLLVKARMEDHKRLTRQFDRVNEIVIEKTERERGRLVELLGVFAAIFAFIFINAQIAMKFTVHESFWLMLSMGDILLIFVVVLSFITVRPSKGISFFKRTRFYILMILTGFLFMIGLGLHVVHPLSVAEAEAVSLHLDKGRNLEGEGEKNESEVIEKKEVEKQSKLKFRKLFIPRKS